jgi:transcriptional regulator with GAF, ATPase, and Fis domain
VLEVDVTARIELEAAARHSLDSQIEFERLIAELSVQFINLPSEDVDHAIERAFQRIAEALDIDRGGLYELPEDGVVTRSIRWARPGVPVVPTPVNAPQEYPWMFETIRSGDVVCFSNLSEVPNPIDRASCEATGTLSAVVVPLLVGSRTVGAVGFNAVRAERTWHPETVHRLRVLATTFANAMARQRSDEALRVALADVKRLSDQLHAENVYLRSEVQAHRGGIIVGQTPAIRRVQQLVQQVAATDSTVLLLGETGTGKELFATQIHERSSRSGRPMVRVNCSAIPTALMESELFGREKGAYTGALTRQIGRFELADQSTVFLDEIGELSPEVQVKLLRVIEERQIERLGSPKSITVNTRIVAATHRDLERCIAEGTFREDLFYRLNVFPIRVPPLRERVEDIPMLVWRFVDEFAKTFGKPIDAIPRENMAALQQYSWPGNIRELRNVVERAMIGATGPRLTIGVPAAAAASEKRSAKLSDVEKTHIRTVLESAGWRVRGAGGAANRLGLKPTTLETRMAKLGITRPKQGN